MSYDLNQMIRTTRQEILQQAAQVKAEIDAMIDEEIVRISLDHEAVIYAIDLEEDRRNELYRISEIVPFMFTANTTGKSSPDLVSKMVICGLRERPMYDDAPSIASFFTPVEKAIDFPLMPLDWIMSQLTVEQLQSVFFTADTLSRLEMYDDTGNLICEADITGHVEWHERQAMSDEEIQQYEAQARELYHEAAVERGWDNHSTADALNERSSSILRKVEIAKNFRNFI